MQVSSFGSVLPEQKIGALQEVLESNTFSRAEQLRNFLRLVCEMEASGRASAINEYVIGVEGLGRAQDFEPASDGIVRSRAHALRQKLFEYYTKENPQAAVRIDLPKGSYVPRFIPAETVDTTAAVALPPPPAPVLPTHSPDTEIPFHRVPVAPDPSKRSRVRDFALGFLAAAALLAVIAWMFYPRASGPNIHPVIAEAWGPLATSGADPLVVLERPTQFLLRTLPSGANVIGVPNGDAPPDVLAGFQPPLPPPPPGMQHRMSGVSSFRFGQVLGMVALLKVINEVGASPQILPDAAVPISNLRGRNALVFGDPGLVPTVARLLQRGYYSVEYDKRTQDFVVRERDTGRTFLSKRLPEDLSEHPGILTVLADEDPDTEKRTVIFAAGNSIGSQAAAEFFASPRSLQDLKDRFAKQKISGFPRAYQVVVMGRSAGPAMLSFSYVAHRVLE